MNKEYPNVLFISQNAFSDTANNGKTFASFFEGWPKDNIAQLYFKNEVPSFKVCEKYFLISDEQIIKNKKNDVGQKIVPKNIDNIKKTYSSFHSYAGKKNKAIFQTIRDILWLTNKWDNQNLANWLNEFKPDLIFFVGGGSLFSYRIVKKISRKFGIPIILYYTDDYIAQGWGNGLFNSINQIRLRLYLKRFLPRVSKVFVIGEDMKFEYQEMLKKECIPIMNAVNINDFEKYSPNNLKGKCENDISLAYFGGLHLNRWGTLAKLGEVVKEISNQKNLNISISIYTTQQLNEEMKKVFEKLDTIKMKGSVSSKEIISEMNKYDILIHAESFDKEMTSQTRLSISTKIPEYLATGKPILAVGPEYLSSIKYLKERTDSFIISDLNQSQKVFLELVSRKEDLTEIGLTNVLLAKENHSKEIEKQKIIDVIKNIRSDQYK